MSVAGIAADSWLLLTNVVVRFAPFQRIAAPERKPVPLAVSVKPGPPAVAVLGEIDDSVGGADTPSCTMRPRDGTPLLLTRKSK